MAINRIKSVGVIGAGMAGLACAEALQAAGIPVTLFEKSRGVGGRMATRRSECGAAFDHGAQYFTVRDLRFREQVEQWCRAGTAALWLGRIIRLEQGVISELNEPIDRYVGLPAMNSIAKSLASKLNVNLNCTIQSIHSFDDGWRLTDSNQVLHGPFGRLVLAIPPQQAIQLTQANLGATQALICDIELAPCWAVMVQFEQRFDVPYDAAFVHQAPFTWVARNSSKPGRDTSDCWVLHASPEWTKEHLEQPADQVAGQLLDEFWHVTGQSPQPVAALAAHRWRFAIPRKPLQQRSIFEPKQRLGLCGDWCGGPRIEGAFLSGIAMAEAILNSPS